MLCSKLDYQKGFNLNPFSYKSGGEELIGGARCAMMYPVRPYTVDTTPVIEVLGPTPYTVKQRHTLHHAHHTRVMCS